MDLKNQEYPSAISYPSAPQASVPVVQAIAISPDEYQLEAPQPPFPREIPQERSFYAAGNRNYQPPSYGTSEKVSQKKPETADCCTLVDLKYWRSVLFHLLNFIIGICALVTLSIGIPLGIGLLPVCCIGVLIFRVMHILLSDLIQLDIRVYNMMVPRNKRIKSIASTRNNQLILADTYASEFSIKSVFSCVFYGVLKFPASTLFSTLALVSLILSLVAGIALLLSVSYMFVDCVPIHLQFTYLHHGHSKTFRQDCLDKREAIVMFFGSLLIMAVAKGLMSISTKALLWFTRYCCAENRASREEKRYIRLLS